MCEQKLDVRRRLGLRSLDALAHRICGLYGDGRGKVVVEDSGATQIALEAADTLALLLLLDPLEVDVRTRIVGSGVRRRAIRHRLDEGRPFTSARARNRLPGGLVAGEHVRAVDSQARHAVTDSFVRERV